jgi:hypothetical protein
MKKSELLFLRRAGGLFGGVENAMVLSVETERPVRRSDVLSRLERAVTKWVNTTEAGREAYLDSSEDLNIADLDGHLLSDESLVQCLTDEGLHKAEIIYSYEGGSEVAYDHHLVKFFEPQPTTH